MKRISLFIAEPQYRMFQQLAREQGRPYAELVRDALDRYLKAQPSRGSQSRADTRRRQKGGAK